MLGRDRLGRGILLTPDGEFCKVYVPKNTVKGEIVRFKSANSLRSAMPVAACFSAMALLVMGMGWGYRFWDHKGLAQLNTPNPPRGEIYATLNLDSPEKVELDLDQEGRILLVRVNGKKVPGHNALGKSVPDALKRKTQVFKGIEIGSGSPMGLRFQKANHDASPASHNAKLGGSSSVRLNATTPESRE